MSTENTIDRTPAVDVLLESSVAPTKDAISVLYSIKNNTGVDIYVLDAFPAVDQKSRTAHADLTAFYLCSREPATAFVLKGIPPLPDKPVMVRIMPLATKLEPNAQINREFSIPLPMRERADWYYPPVPLEDYAAQAADRIVFEVQYLRSSVDGFTAVPAHYAAGYFVVSSKSTVKQAETLRAEFTIEKAQLFVRKDRFTRM